MNTAVRGVGQRAGACPHASRPRPHSTFPPQFVNLYIEGHQQDGIKVTFSPGRTGGASASLAWAPSLLSSEEHIIIKFDEFGEKKFVSSIVFPNLKKSDREPPVAKRATRTRKPKVVPAVAG